MRSPSAAVRPVAAGVEAVFNIDVKPCMSWVAIAGFDASCWMNGSPGTPGVGAGAAGWAPAVALSATAAVTAPAAAIIVVASEFSGAVHGSPIQVLSAGLRPKLRSY